jgi:hypothetical protein
MRILRLNLSRWLSLCALAAIVGISTVGTASASEFDEFGIESVSAVESTNQAGMHPDITTRFDLNKKKPEETTSAGRVNAVAVSLPPGLVANPNLVPACSTGQFLAFNCPIDSQVGVVNIHLDTLGSGTTSPLYRLQSPGRDTIARFGFVKVTFPLFLDVKVRTADDYGVTAIVHGASATSTLASVETNIWGDPSNPSHNAERLTVLESLFCHTACLAPGGERPSNLASIPFTTNPAACQAQEVGFDITSYELPGQVFHADAPLPPTVGCESLSFQPALELTPTSRAAGAPTGLDARLRIPQTSSTTLPATSSMRAAKVVLPEGMTIAAGAAEGLQGCSKEQIHLGEEVGSECPQAAKLGSATFVSPALPEPLHGAIYQRAPEPGHLFRLWLASDDLGLHLKIPGEVQADPRSGQLTVVFDETPQLPVEEIDLELKGGPRAPLKNPDRCGAYAASYELTPWSGNTAAMGQSEFTIDEGCGAAWFSPSLSAGVEEPLAGAFSPLSIELASADGEENLAGLDLDLPEGELAKLRRVPPCPETEAASGACPPASGIGSVDVATGSGPLPLWIPQPGKEPTAVYLAGAYRGAPYSAIAKVPAQAGPFDLGTVVVRAALDVDPRTAQVSVRSDSLPQILEGVPIHYRTIHLGIERPNFALNPTDCEQMAIRSTVVSAQGATAHPKDRFQVGECGRLGFSPKLGLRLTGATKRGGFPALRATVRARHGDANIGRAVVTLPHSEFLEQGHIQTICTRVQFAADTCPAGSVYGRAMAKTPLLDEPLEGPVYLRSSSHKLPDLVADLNGQIHIVLVGRIDSVGGGIRARFGSVPDAPVSSVTFAMQGGKKSLLVNSTDVCTHINRVLATFTGQNGKRHLAEPPLRARC